MDTAAAWIFWGSAAVLFYTYAGFGLLVVFWGAVRRRLVHSDDITPSVSLIVAAYNEEEVIEEKLRNCLLLDYPSRSLEVILASDGSDDRTESIACTYSGGSIRLLALPRRGKIHALADAVQRARGEILVFSDANTLLHASALRKLVRNFADSRVGGVCGNQMHTKNPGSDSSEGGESLYWSYDKWLKTMETRTGSIVSADGAIYAIRRHLFRKPEITAVTDDFAISTAVVEQGYRLVFEAEALAYEPATGAARREFQRKVRLMNRGMRGVLLRRRLLNPFRFGFYSLTLFSHKVVRRVAPVFLITLFLASLSLADQPFFARLALLQAGFYSLAFLGWCLKSRSLGRVKILSLPFFYCMANAAALVALVKLVRGERIERWQPQRQALKA
jgi:cellulose synthase/poly-beta-1,6-N-acetylglucosamine synthase-like glycosyltransferase